ncbi:terminase large subunit [Subdoligranulum variabile]|uniref:Phage terminase, large subunit n=1 Tax=Subdoligranulum variabile DSM 15176 TaxID=411471 RepID=D1PNC7_9FIRM|nr:terminase TerL endonuclease subunit [Subdoligranulum variabile]EFB76062.1 putative phage terminase, large subunit [Subdoligranulum variabile DSM 15176]UWP68711.1 terminase large subunit [Subdoligranulum variabile]
MLNYILAYYQAIQNGSEVVGRWVRLMYEYVVKGLQSQSFFFDQKKANKAIRFIETFCHHCEGRNDLLKLELWQKAFVSVVFGVVGADGLRQFREVVLIIARKNGKSLFAAAIIAYCIYLDGEYGAKVYCVAPKLDQAEIVYSAFWQTIQKEPELAARIKRRKSDFYIAETNSSVKKIAFNAKKSDGFNPSLTVCDEIASWPGQAGLKQYEVMKSALGARKQPLILSISTSGYENEGIYDELIKRSTRFLLGDSRERRLAPFLYMIDDIDKWNDINELRKSNPNLGVSVSVDYLLEEIAVAEGSLSKKAEFLTKYCNIKQNSSQAWLSNQAVEKACGDPLDLAQFRDCYCVGGIDLSRTTDLTACTAVIEKDGRLYVFAHFFLPAERLEEATARDGLPYDIYVQRGFLTLSGDNFVNYHDCFDWFRALVEQYQIYPLKVGYDRYTAQYLVQDMKQYGFHMDDVFQGFNLTPVICETEGLMRDGAFDIGDNDLLKVHLLDMATKTEAESGRCRPVKLSAKAHIDGGAALLDAMTVRQKYYAEIGEQLKNAS